MKCLINARQIENHLKVLIIILKQRGFYYKYGYGLLKNLVLNVLPTKILQ